MHDGVSRSDEPKSMNGLKHLKLNELGRQANAHIIRRKHREKKENYVLALEQEVHRLQGELCAAHVGLGFLKEALISHGITLPDANSPYILHLQADDNVAQVALVGPPGPHQHFQIQTTDRTRLSPLATETEGTINLPAQATPQNSTVPHELSESYGRAAMVGDNGYGSSRMAAPSPGHLDPDIARFDFILTYGNSSKTQVLLN